jgi:hypothetical protein
MKDRRDWTITWIYEGEVVLEGMTGTEKHGFGHLIQPYLNL